MADIELVIKIPEEMYKWVNDANKLYNDYGTSDFVELIKNGTPLPKGHGDLITKEQAIELVEFYKLNPQHFEFESLMNDIKYSKPIVRSDKEVD